MTITLGWGTLKSEYISYSGDSGPLTVRVNNVAISPGKVGFFDNVVLKATSGVSPFASTSNIPEPSSTALLGIGGLALILRRKK